MDGFERRVRSTPPPLVPSILDFGRTPPWSLPPVLYEESALRSTCAQETLPETVDPAVLQRPNLTDGILPSCCSSLNKASTCSSLPRSRKHAHNSDVSHTLPDDENAGDDVEISVDTEHDEVYMINQSESSWSGTLLSEDNPIEQENLPAQAVLALKKLKRAQELDQEALRVEAVNVAIEALLKEKQAAGMAPEDKVKWNKDLLLQNILRRVKTDLQRGATLTLERMTPTNPTIACAHPFCSTTNNLIAIGSYYVIVTQSCQTKHGLRFCLSCLEGLWNGKDIISSLPDPQLYIGPLELQEGISSFALDGAMDDARLRIAGLPPVGANMTPSSMRFTPSTSFTPVKSGPLLTPPQTRGILSPREAASFEPFEEPATNTASDSPLLRKSQLSEFKSLPDKTLVPGPKESFAAKVKKASSKPKPKPKLTIEIENAKPCRRSARLESLSSYRSSATSTPSNTPQSTVSKEKPVPSKPRSMTADAIADEVEKAETRLRTMYQNRGKALSTMLPGEWTAIELPKHSKSKKKPTIRMDVFGNVYTDLLADHVKYWNKHLVMESFDEHGKIGSGAVKKAVKKESTPQLPTSTKIADRWCFCHGVEKGKMIECGNQNCLIGWYHLACIGSGGDEKHDWICPLCSSLESQFSMMPLPPTDLETILAASAPMFAEHAVYDIEHVEINEDKSATPNETEHISSLPQVDGSLDVPKPQFRPSKPSPLNPTFNRLPESLLSSKHAPPADELSSYIVHQTRTKTLTPPSPGLPESPPGSTDSFGEWINPPTRFQHLAQFFRPGDSLTVSERAALDLWKETTAEQLHWNGHRERYNKTIEELKEVAGGEEDGENVLEDAEVQKIRQQSSGFCRPEKQTSTDSNSFSKRVGSVQRHDDDGGGSDEDELVGEDIKRLCRKMCYGKDLTAVLADMHAVQSSRN